MKSLYLYLISQTVNNDYDTFDSAVVVADTPEDAKKIHPGGKLYQGSNSGEYCWCKVEQVEIAYLGIASPELIEGRVICASFNAG